jgi:hypothetical protein
MKLAALYVYSPTSFKVDSPIEGMGKGVVTPLSVTANNTTLCEVVLTPGVYRLAAAANLAPSQGASFAIVPLPQEKRPWPDPPAQATAMFGKDQIVAFLSGTGEETVV